jgi:ABC-type transporter Mla subunit MlaD
VADLGIAKRRKRAKKLDIPVGDLPRETGQTEVSPGDIESLRGNLASVEGQLEILRENIPNISETEVAGLSANILQITESIQILEEITGELNGQVAILKEAFASFDVGAYDVEEFPI